MVRRESDREWARLPARRRPVNNVQKETKDAGSHFTGSKYACWCRVRRQTESVPWGKALADQETKETGG